MNRHRGIFRAWPGLVALACVQAASVWACSACYGQSDSAMARGFNWGILSLLGVVVMVLGGITTFFVFLGKKSALASAASTDPSRITNYASSATGDRASRPADPSSPVSATEDHASRITHH